MTGVEQAERGGAGKQAGRKGGRDRSCGAWGGEAGGGGG